MCYPKMINSRIIQNSRIIFSLLYRLFFYILHSKNRLLTVKWFLSLLKDFLFETGIRGNPLTVKGLSFQMLSFYCQSISSGLEMKLIIIIKSIIFNTTITSHFGFPLKETLINNQCSSVVFLRERNIGSSGNVTLESFQCSTGEVTTILISV